MEIGHKKVVDCSILKKTDFSAREKELPELSLNSGAEYLRELWHIGHFAQQEAAYLTTQIYPTNVKEHKPNEYH